MAWQIQGQYMETCNCAFLCPCIVSNLAARPTEGGCKAVMGMLIEKGEINEIKEAMEKSMAPGSQTFEQALFKMFMDGVITQEECMLNADSATNMLWLINQATAGELSLNGGARPVAKPDDKKDKAALNKSFNDFKIDVNA